MATKKTPEQIAAEKAAKEQKAKEKAAAAAAEKAAKEKAAQEAAEQAAATGSVGDLPGATKSPEFRGNSATKPTPEKAQTPAKKTKQALAKDYAKLYPKNKTFYVTSDDQVFLEGDKSLAQMHQNTLATGEEIETVNV